MGSWFTKQLHPLNHCQNLVLLLLFLIFPDQLKFTIKPYSLPFFEQEQSVTHFYRFSHFIYHHQNISLKLVSHLYNLIKHSKWNFCLLKSLLMQVYHLKTKVMNICKPFAWSIYQEFNDREGLPRMEDGIICTQVLSFKHYMLSLFFITLLKDGQTRYFAAILVTLIKS